MDVVLPLLECPWQSCRSSFHTSEELFNHASYSHTRPGYWWCPFCKQWKKTHTTRSTHCKGARHQDHAYEFVQETVRVNPRPRGQQQPEIREFFQPVENEDEDIRDAGAQEGNFSIL